MKVTRKFLALPWHKQRLLLRSLLLLLRARVGLAALPFPVVLRLHEPGVRRPRFLDRVVPPTPEQIAWAIALTSRFIPGGRNCLVHALAATAQLRRDGYAARLCIGVDRRASNHLDAHAWVELNGRHVIGGTAESRYTRLFAWEGGRA